MTNIARSGMMQGGRPSGWSALTCLIGFFAVLLSFSPAAADDQSVCRSREAPPDEAIAACNHLIDGGAIHGKELAPRYVDRGIHWRRKGNPDLALKDYENALALDPKLSIAYLSRGNVWFDKKDLERALKDYGQAIALASNSDPNRALAYALRGRVRRLKGDLDQALADFDEAITQSNSLPAVRAEAYVNRGIVWQTRKEFDRALDDFNHAVVLANSSDSNLVLAYINRGGVWQAKEDFDRALADFDAAIKSNPKLALAYFRRGFLWYRKGTAERTDADRDNNDAATIRVIRDSVAVERAIKDYGEAIRLDPKYQVAYNNRGNALLLKGDLDGALADYSAAISLNAKNPIPYVNRCLLRRRKSDHDGAIADCSAAIRLDPSYTAASTFRGLSFESKGDREAARADYTSALALPAKYESGKRAHDIARARLAVLASAASNVPNPAVPPPVTPAINGKLALVIGNGAYRTVPLANAASDARAVAKALRDIRFEVIEGIDLDNRGMRRVLTEFLLKAPSARIALMFYAGHGVQIKGRNYLAPIDATFRSEATSDLELISLDNQVLDGLSDPARTNIIILDACRNNPFGNSGRAGSGLALPSSSDAGTLVAFATQPNGVAIDGSGQHSPYTTALLKYIGDPKLEVVAMFREVGKAVSAATGGKQSPYLSLPPLGDLYLAKNDNRAGAN